MLSLWANWLVTKFGLNSLRRYLWPVLYMYLFHFYKKPIRSQNEIHYIDTNMITNLTLKRNQKIATIAEAVIKFVQWNLVIKRSDITKPSYNKVILLVPALYSSLFYYPDIMRNLI